MQRGGGEGRAALVNELRGTYACMHACMLSRSPARRAVALLLRAIAAAVIATATCCCCCWACCWAVVPAVLGSPAHPPTSVEPAGSHAARLLLDDLVALTAARKYSKKHEGAEAHELKLKF